MMNLKCRIDIMFAVFMIVSSVIIIASCGGKTADTSPAVKSFGPSFNSSGPLDERYVNNPELIPADIYAEHYGVTEEEALQRFDISDAFSGLGYELETKETETFGGLWIQHEPSFCVAIAFTRDGEETIKKYVSENLTGYVEVRTVKYTYRELQDIQLEVMAALRDLGIPFGGGVYVQENCVEFNVTDRTEIDKAIEEGRLIIPECVRITVVSGLPVLC